jgi:hypothetical protein
MNGLAQPGLHSSLLTAPAMLAAHGPLMTGMQSLGFIVGFRRKLADRLQSRRVRDRHLGSGLQQSAIAFQKRLLDRRAHAGEQR